MIGPGLVDAEQAVDLVVSLLPAMNADAYLLLDAFAFALGDRGHLHQEHQLPSKLAITPNSSSRPTVRKRNCCSSRATNLRSALQQGGKPGSDGPGGDVPSRIIAAVSAARNAHEACHGHGRGLCRPFRLS